MIVESPIVEGRLIRRYKRFLMDLQLEDGSVLTVHCPNSGSMEGCLEQGARVLASRSDNPKRKLSCTAEWIHLKSGWVGINTHRANRIVEEALRLGRVPSLAGYGNVRPEVPYDGNSRVDFLLTESGLPPCYVEVKNTTWPSPDGGHRLSGRRHRERAETSRRAWAVWSGMGSGRSCSILSIAKTVLSSGPPTKKTRLTPGRWRPPCAPAWKYWPAGSSSIRPKLVWDLPCPSS